MKMCPTCHRPLPEPETCPKNCAHYDAKAGRCHHDYLPGSPECRKHREPDDGYTREELEEGR